MCNLSLDQLTQFSEDLFPNCLGGYLKDFGASLELYKASQIITHPDESVLENINSWTSRFLKHGLSSDSVWSDRTDSVVKQEVFLAMSNGTFFLPFPLLFINKNLCFRGHHQAVNALEFPYNATLERLISKRAMESYSGDIVRLSKSPYAYVANSFTFYSLFLLFFFVCWVGVLGGSWTALILDLIVPAA